MNSRRFTSNFSRASKRKMALRETYRTAGFRTSLCRLWVNRVTQYSHPKSGQIGTRHSAQAGVVHERILNLTWLGVECWQCRLCSQDYVKLLLVDFSQTRRAEGALGGLSISCAV